MKKLLLILCVLFVTAGIIAQERETDYDLPEDCTSENDAVFYYDRGYEFYNSADYETALLDFSCAAYLDDTYLNAMHMRGLMFELLERPEDAYKAFSQVVEIDPEYDISYIGMGNAALDLEDYESAVEHFTQYIALDETSAAVFYSRAIAYYDLEDYDASVDDYTQAILLDPAYTDAYGGRASAYNALGDYEAALNDIQAAFNIELKDVAWMYPTLAEAHTGLRQFDEAQEAYDRYLEAFPDLAATYQPILDELNGCLVKTSQNVNRRVNSGLEYAVLGVLAGGDSAFVDAKRTDSEGNVWWRLEDRAGWVRSDTVTESEACSTVPDVTPN